MCVGGRLLLSVQLLSLLRTSLSKSAISFAKSKKHRKMTVFEAANVQSMLPLTPLHGKLFCRLSPTGKCYFPVWIGATLCHPPL
jgi:hypothetical protein